MSDQRLRELERRWAQTRDSEDEAAFLRESLRAGELSRDRLELAARLGHQAALKALEVTQPPADSIKKLLNDLVPHGHEAVFRAGVAILRPLTERWSMELPEDLRVPEALRAAERWLETPTAEAVTAAQLAAADARLAAAEGHNNAVDAWHDYYEDRREGVSEPNLSATFTIAGFAQAVADGVDVSAATLAEDLEAGIFPCFQGVWFDVRDEHGDHYDDGGWANPVAVDTHIFDALRDGLVSWALGRVEIERGPSIETNLAQVEPEQLALLAYCGHPDALAIVEHVPPPPRELEAWVRGLTRFGREALAVAALAAADTVQQYWEDGQDTRPQAALRAVSTWVASPCEEHVEAAIDALDGAVDAMTETAPLARKKRGATPHCSAEAAARTIEVVCEDDAAEAAWGVIEAARVGLSSRRLLDVMRASLSEWALSRVR